MQVADALEEEEFAGGDLIIKQDTPGDKFYIIKSVRALAAAHCMAPPDTCIVLQEPASASNRFCPRVCNEYVENEGTSLRLT